MKRKKKSTLMLGDRLSGAQLAIANTILRYHGLPEAEKPGTVIELLQPSVPLEMGRFTHVVGDLCDALERGEA